MNDMKEIFKMYKGKRVLVTGHTGFKGSWLTFLLKEIGADVMGLGLSPATPVNHFDLLGLDNKIKHVVGDISDPMIVSKMMNEFQPEFVFHLAAQALVRPSYVDPAKTYLINVMGSVNVLDAVRNCQSVRSLVYITSDKCYENVEWTWGYRENDRLGGRDPYSASKAAAEIVFSSYLRSFFESRSSLGAASTRAGNVIGGGDWALDRIVPDCIRSIENNEPILLRNPNATRPWQHVLEPISGYLLLAARLYEDPKYWSGSWNFGPSTNEVHTVEEVTKIIISHLGKGSIKLIEPQSQIHEANLLQLNCDKANQQLGWHPRWNPALTFKATAIWYKNIMEGHDPIAVTRSQIYEFFPELL